MSLEYSPGGRAPLLIDPHAYGVGWLRKMGQSVCLPHPSSPLLLSSLELSDTQVYEPSIRALLGTPLPLDFKPEARN